MNDKQFTDELFKRMYNKGYRKAEIEDDTLFFFVNKRDYLCPFLPRVPVKSTCFEVKDQLIDVAEYIGIIDWSKVKVDTPILVKDNCDDRWEKAYFAGYENGMVHAWIDGRTSFSARSKDDTFTWDSAKLAEV